MIEIVAVLILLMIVASLFVVETSDLLVSVISVGAVGFLDPSNPHRMLRKLRRMFGRAGITEDEVAMLRGVCRQMLWAARTGPLAERRSNGENVSE